MFISTQVCITLDLSKKEEYDLYVKLWSDDNWECTFDSTELVTFKRSNIRFDKDTWRSQND